MAAGLESQLYQICSDPETLSEARELFNIARAKTGPGSGRDLGPKAVALPAICALLACEVLGTTDVTERIAQQTSCLAPKGFKSAYSIVKNAMAATLQKRRSRTASFEFLVESYDLDDDVFKWMKKVHQALLQSGELDELRVEENAVICTVFHWVCISFRIRNVKSQALISDYHYPVQDGQRVHKVLDKICSDIRQEIEDILAKERATRSNTASPVKTSPVKVNAFSSPTKRAVGMRIGTGGSLLKRKPSQSDFSTPTKRYRDVDLSDFDDTPASSGRQRSSPMPESPTKEKGKGKAVLRMLDDSPTKSLRNDLQAFSLNEDAQLSTPRAARKPQNSFKKTHVPESRTSPQMDMNVDVSDYSDVETSTRRTCQRHPPPFLDRLFWSTRDPLVQREYDRGEAVYNKLVQV